MARKRKLARAIFFLNSNDPFVIRNFLFAYTDAAPETTSMISLVIAA